MWDLLSQIQAFFQPSKTLPHFPTSVLLIYDANAILNYTKVIQPAETKISMNEGRMLWFSVQYVASLAKAWISLSREVCVHV